MDCAASIGTVQNLVCPGSVDTRGAPILHAKASSLLQSYLAKRAELVRFFTARMRSEASAEDLVQEIYLRISRTDAGDIRDPTAFLYRLGWNLMLDQLRSQRRTAARDADWSGVEVAASGEVALDPSPPADQRVEARQRLERLVARLDTLPPQTQKAFRLHKFEGLSHAETAVRLGVSKSAVEKHISAALKKLLEDEG
jgi:RNA polymerase sigma factor (sigma-70 family)